jgi:MoaA/NifB/PqqE/SkfB family radical SAM enzyme
MCDYWKTPSDPRRELSTAQIKVGLAKVAAHGCRFVNFSGGEPTLRADLEEIVAEASALGMWTSMVSNGSLLTRNRIARLSEAGLDSLLLSLDSVSPAVHDEERGFPGLHQRVLQCLGWLADEFVVGHRIGGFMTVISQRNCAEVEELVSLADRIGVYALFQPEHAQKTGRAADVTAVPPALVQTLIQRRRRGASILNSREYLRGLALPPVNEARRECHAGRKYFSIDPFGRLHPCVDGPAVGHVLEDAIETISTDASRAAARSCAGCWYCFRGEADATLSTAGCLDKAGLGLQVLGRNGRRGLGRRRAARRAAVA